MSRRHSRGSAGTLRQLGPKAPRRAKRQHLCAILTGSGYLAAIMPNSEPVFDADVAKALPLPRDAAQQVCLGLTELGYTAEMVGAPR